MKKYLNTPSLRFKEFRKDWESKSLGELLEFKNGINASKEQYGTGVKFINILDILNNDYITYDKIIGSVNVPEQVRNKNLVEYGDILFQRSSETREEVGTASVYLDKNQCATFGGFVIRGKKIGEYDPVFLNNLLKTSQARESITSKSGGSTRFNVGQEVLSGITLKFPGLNEQQKIASFLSTVDLKIEALKNRRDRLEQYKKGIIQKVFSKELRFKDDNGNGYAEWKLIKLGEILLKNSIKNKGEKYSIVQSVSNKHGFINQDEMFEERRVASVNTSNYYVISKGYFAYNPSRINVGSLAYKYDDITSIISPLYISFKAKKDVILDSYLKNWFSSEDFIRQMNSSFEGSVRNTLNYESLTSMVIKLPELKEQKKISDFISVIENRLRMTEIQIAKTEQWKKGLLQKMFC